jgi:hypothetical protein
MYCLAMANKKRSKRTAARKKKTVAKRAPGHRTKARRNKRAPRPKAASKKSPGKKAPGRKTAEKKRSRPAPATRPARGRAGSGLPTPSARRGLGPEAGGQSGDTEGLSRAELADSESVEELLEEGQAFEAGIVRGVENAPGPEKGGVRTRQVPEDDVPQEYLDED